MLRLAVPSLAALLAMAVLRRCWPMHNLEATVITRERQSSSARTP